MRLRRSLLTALVVALAATTSANAATKPKPKPKPITYCNLLKDKANDGHSSTYSFVTSPALDIQSGDVATGKNELVAVLRVGSTSTSGDNWVTIGGYGWTFSTAAGGTSYVFQMNRRGALNGGGDHWSATIGGVGVAVDGKITSNTFEWHVKRSLLTSLNKKAGQWFSAFDASSQFNGSTADTPDSTTVVTKYPDRGLSCVKAL